MLKKFSDFILTEIKVNSFFWWSGLLFLRCLWLIFELFVVGFNFLFFWSLLAFLGWLCNIDHLVIIIVIFSLKLVINKETGYLLKFILFWLLCRRWLEYFLCIGLFLIFIWIYTWTFQDYDFSSFNYLLDGIAFIFIALLFFWFFLIFLGWFFIIR